MLFVGGILNEFASDSKLLNLMSFSTTETYTIAKNNTVGQPLYVRRTEVDAGENITLGKNATVGEPSQARESPASVDKNDTLDKPLQVRKPLATSKPPDAFIEGQPLYLVKGSPPVSHVHCLGENFQPNAWMYRSCQFENLCFNLNKKTFVLHPSEDQLKLESQLHDQTFLSSKVEDMISGGQHPQWLRKQRGKWQPEVQPNGNSTKSYYAFSEDTVWISFYPWGGCNPGHLLWDSFLPIYTLLEMFDLKDKELFLTEMFQRKGDCPELMNQFAPMMGMKRKPQKTKDLNFTTANNKPQSSNMVCVRHSASGMGWLTDNGLSYHGTRGRDFNTPHNIGRAANLAGFRQYLLGNIGLGNANMIQKPYRVTFSILSSRDEDRRFTFDTQVKAMKAALPPDVEIQSIAMWNYTVREQIEIAARSTVYISVNGGGTNTAFFMPKGASLILYGKQNERMDFDLFNNYAQLRTHWLTLSHKENDTDFLVSLVREELQSIEAFSSKPS